MNARMKNFDSAKSDTYVMSSSHTVYVIRYIRLQKFLEECSAVVIRYHTPPPNAQVQFWGDPATRLCASLSHIQKSG